MAKTILDYDIVDCPADEPIVFSGPPSRLSGRLPVRNAGTDVAVLRRASVRGDQLLRDAVAAVRTTVLRPQMSADLRVRLTVAPNTPPGEYRGEVEIGGSTRPALLRVVEVIDVIVSPGVLFVENNPGTTVVKRVFVHNRGNVPVTIGHPGGIALDDERGECRVTRATYEALGRSLEERSAKRRRPKRGSRADGDKDTEDGPIEPELTLERAFGEWVKQGREHLAGLGVLGVRNAAGTTVINGGEEAEVQFRIRVPKALDQHSRYVGSFPIYDTDLGFVIVPGSGRGNGDPTTDDEHDSGG